MCRKGCCQPIRPFGNQAGLQTRWFPILRFLQHPYGENEQRGCLKAQYGVANTGSNGQISMIWLCSDMNTRNITQRTICLVINVHCLTSEVWIKYNIQSSYYFKYLITYDLFYCCVKNKMSSKNLIYHQPWWQPLTENRKAIMKMLIPMDINKHNQKFCNIFNFTRTNVCINLSCLAATNILFSKS